MPLLQDGTHARCCLPCLQVTGYHNVARNFFQKHGFEHVVLLSADGALEAAPLMGTADIILDLVSTGTLLLDAVSGSSASCAIGHSSHC